MITLEGLDCAGKSSHINDTEKYLTAHDVAVLVTREPGGCDLGREIRRLLLEPEYTGMDQYTELLLLFADRNEHIDKVIKPALQSGTWVVCERFADASYAYQSAARGIDRELVDVLMRYTVRGLKPELTFLLDIAPEVALQRIHKKAEPDRFEREPREFFEQIARAYRTMACEDGKRWHVIDGTRSYDEVQDEINSKLLQVLQ